MDRSVPRPLIAAAALMCMRSGSGRGSDLAAGRSGTHSQRAFLGGARPGRSGAAGTEETGGGAPRLARGAAGVGRIGSAPQTNLRTPRKSRAELARRFKGSASAREFATNTASQPGIACNLHPFGGLVEIGHISEARAALKRLFPQGPPGASFVIDYYCCWRARPTDSRRRTRASAVWPQSSG